MNPLRKRVLIAIGNLLYTWHQTWLYNHIKRNRQCINQQCKQRLFLYARNVVFPYDLESLGEKHISIGEGTHIGEHCILTAWEKTNAGGDFHPEIHIGKNCSIGEYNHITSTNKIEIGDNLLTGRWVTIFM